MFYIPTWAESLKSGKTDKDGRILTLMPEGLQPEGWQGHFVKSLHHRLRGLHDAEKPGSQAIT